VRVCAKDITLRLAPRAHAGDKEAVHGEGGEGEGGEVRAGEVDVC
jgi:hypothetical protein